MHFQYPYLIVLTDNRVMLGSTLTASWAERIVALHRHTAATYRASLARMFVLLGLKLGLISVQQPYSRRIVKSIRRDSTIFGPVHGITIETILHGIFAPPDIHTLLPYIRLCAFTRAYLSCLQ